MDRSDHVFVAVPSIKRVEDLKGKRIGIITFGGTPHNQTVIILRKYGVNPDKDVTFLQIGGASRYTALETGSIHATMLPPLNKVARENISVGPLQRSQRAVETIGTLNGGGPWHAFGTLQSARGIQKRLRGFISRVSA